MLHFGSISTLLVSPGNLTCMFTLLHLAKYMYKPYLPAAEAYQKCTTEYKNRENIARFISAHQVAKIFPILGNKFCFLDFF